MTARAAQALGLGRGAGTAGGTGAGGAGGGRGGGACTPAMLRTAGWPALSGGLRMSIYAAGSQQSRLTKAAENRVG